MFFEHNLAELTALVKPRLKRMQYRPGLLTGFLSSTRLDSHRPATPQEQGSLGP